MSRYLLIKNAVIGACVAKVYYDVCTLDQPWAIITCSIAFGGVFFALAREFDKKFINKKAK